MVRVPPSGKYTGTQLQATIRTLQGLLDQGIPAQELQVKWHVRLFGGDVSLLAQGLGELPCLWEYG